MVQPWRGGGSCPSPSLSLSLFLHNAPARPSPARLARLLPCGRAPSMHVCMHETSGVTARLNGPGAVGLGEYGAGPARHPAGRGWAPRRGRERGSAAQADGDVVVGADGSDTRSAVWVRHCLPVLQGDSGLGCAALCGLPPLSVSWPGWAGWAGRAWEGAMAELEQRPPLLDWGVMAEC